MGTRCTIKIEGVNFAKIYKHWDGNPEATLPWLEAFNAEFTKTRGKDPQYKFAQLLRNSAFAQSQFNLDPSVTLGWGVTEYKSKAGAEYEYELLADGSVATYKVD